MTKARDLANVGSVAAGGLMFRNRLINGGFTVQQRSDVTVSASGQYGPDRWVGAISGGTSVSGTWKKNGFATASTGMGGWYLGASFTTGVPYWNQKIESLNVQDLGGGQITVSGKAYQDTGSTQTLVVRISKANAVDNFSAVTYLGTSSGTAIASAVVVPFSATFTLAAGDSANGISVEIYYQTAITVSNKNFGIADIQLEKGAVATPFEFRPYGAELSLCYRYFEALSFIVDSMSAVGQALSSTTATHVVHFQKKRAIPTVTVSGPLIYLTATGSSAGSATSSYRINDASVRMYDTGLSGLVAGNATMVYPNGSACTYSISAEL